MRQVAGPFLQLENLVLGKTRALLDARKVYQGTLKVAEGLEERDGARSEFEGFKLR